MPEIPQNIKEKKGKTIAFRPNIDESKFLAQKAIEVGLVSTDDRPMTAVLVAKKISECIKYGWDKPPEVNVEGINFKTKSEIMAEMGAVYEESVRYKALCIVIESKSHNGLPYYMKEVDKILKQNKKN